MIVIILKSEMNYLLFRFSYSDTHLIGEFLQQVDTFFTAAAIGTACTAWSAAGTASVTAPATPIY